MQLMPGCFGIASLLCWVKGSCTHGTCMWTPMPTTTSTTRTETSARLWIFHRKHKTAWIKITLFILHNGSERMEKMVVCTQLHTRLTVTDKNNMKNAHIKWTTHGSFCSHMWAPAKHVCQCIYDYNYIGVMETKHSNEWNDVTRNAKCWTHYVRISISFFVFLSTSCADPPPSLCAVAVGCAEFWFAAQVKIVQFSCYSDQQFMQIVCRSFRIPTNFSLMWHPQSEIETDKNALTHIRIHHLIPIWIWRVLFNTLYVIEREDWLRMRKGRTNCRRNQHSELNTIRMCASAMERSATAPPTQRYEFGILDLWRIYISCAYMPCYNLCAFVWFLVSVLRKRWIIIIVEKWFLCT